MHRSALLLASSVLLPLCAVDIDGIDRFFVRAIVSTTPTETAETTYDNGVAAATVDEGWRAGLEIGASRGLGLPLIGLTGSLGAIYGQSTVNESSSLSPLAMGALGLGAVQSEAELTHEDIGGQVTFGPTINLTTLFHADLVGYASYAVSRTEVAGSTVVLRPGRLPISGAFGDQDDEGRTYDYGARAGAWVVLLFLEVGVVGGWGSQVHSYSYDSGIPSLLVTGGSDPSTLLIAQQLAGGDRERTDEGFWAGLSLGLSF